MTTVLISLIVEHCKVIIFHSLYYFLTKHFVLAGNGWVSLSNATAAFGCVLGVKRMFGTMVLSSNACVED